MQTVIKKVYLSIMISIFCMITLVTTTFAWIGFLDFTEIEEFDINLNSSELEEYGIEISLTGEEGTFGSSVDAIALKKNILLNMGANVNSLSNEEINKLFGDLNLDQCTVLPNADKSFPDFLDMNDKITKAYFKFDIYISAFQAFDSGENSNSEYYLNAFLYGDLLKGTLNTKNLMNEYKYPSNFINSSKNGILAGTAVKNDVTIDSASACRLAILKYNVVDKYDVLAYNNNSTINDLIIFQGGTAMPTYDDKTKIYSFGGIMEDEYNLALYDYNKKNPKKPKTIPYEYFSRGDIEYNNNYQIIDSSNNEEKIGINQMMKMTVFFWFEGWDADCFNIINNNPVSINLNFSTEKI